MIKPNYTSIQERINQLSVPEPETNSNGSTSAKQTTTLSLKPLLSFDGAAIDAEQAGIPFHFADYLDLIDWTGLAVRNDKRGAIATDKPKLLTELGISNDAWLTSAKEFRRQYSGISGRWDAICAMKAKCGGKWCKGKQQRKAIHPN